MKAIMALKKLSDELSLEPTDLTLNLKLKYCKDEKSFDYFMQMLYGSPSVKVPLVNAAEIITTCLEIGILLYNFFLFLLGIPNSDANKSVFITKKFKEKLIDNING